MKCLISAGRAASRMVICSPLLVMSFDWCQVLLLLTYDRVSAVALVGTPSRPRWRIYQDAKYKTGRVVERYGKGELDDGDGVVGVPAR